VIAAVPKTERKLIQRIRSLAQDRQGTGRSLITGIGDDCAVLRPPAGHEILVTTDFSLENVHFRRNWHPPESVGHRCLTRGLSDIAAMGGKPLAVFLSLAVPNDLPQTWVDKFYRGLLRLAKRHQVALGGGDTAKSPTGVLADIMVIGSVPRGKAVLRSGAKPGDHVYVTGALGESAAEIRKRYAGQVVKLPRLTAKSRFLFPEPRLSAAERLRGAASAMIDISDGISTDLAHISEESSVGAVIHAASIPVAANATLDDALHGGDDYELLFTSSRRIPAEIAGVPVTEVGEVTARRGLWLQDEHGRNRRLKPAGWQHFVEPN
jgi:thiamine-monophosphate kinase